MTDYTYEVHPYIGHDGETRFAICNARTGESLLTTATLQLALELIAETVAAVNSNQTVH
jgi:hypothetical protein